jgi:hypothetical protein
MVIYMINDNIANGCYQHDSNVIASAIIWLSSAIKLIATPPPAPEPDRPAVIA